MRRLLPVLGILALLAGRAWAISGTANQITFQNGTIAFANNPIRVNEGGTGASSFANTNQPIVAGATSTGALVSISAGTAGNVLVSAGASAPTWTTINLASANAVGSSILGIANGGSNKALTLAAGAVLWTDADSFEVGPVGSAGECLKSGGTGAPTWGACSTATPPVLFVSSNGDLTGGSTVHTGGGTTDTTQARAQTIAPVALSADNLHCVASTAPGSGNTFVATFATGACTGALTDSTTQTCTISGTNRTCNDGIAGAAEPVTQGNCWAVKIVSLDGDTATSVVSCEFTG